MELRQAAAFAAIASFTSFTLLGPVSCFLQLDRVLSCGDGYVDELAGEECDPANPDSFVDACRDRQRPQGRGACDPETCELIDDETQCQVCGDGFVDAEEECDGDNLNGATCPGGGLQCTAECEYDSSACETCGNGVPEPEFGEECEPPRAGQVAAMELEFPLCPDVPTEPPITGKPSYMAGSIQRCRLDCRWDRSPCTFCGDGKRDTALPVNTEGAFAPAESCDGNDIPLTELESSPLCPESGQLPNVTCDESCLGWKQRPGPTCCLAAGESCPDADDELRCCYELANPSAEDPCQEIFTQDSQLHRVCR